MPNTFKSSANTNISATSNTIYTCPTATQTTLIGMTIANRSANPVTANVWIRRSSINYLVAANSPIPTGSSLVVVGGDQKVVLQAADELTVNVSTALAVDVVASLLEIS